MRTRRNHSTEEPEVELEPLLLENSSSDTTSTTDPDDAASTTSAEVCSTLDGDECVAAQKDLFLEALHSMYDMEAQHFRLPFSKEERKFLEVRSDRILLVVVELVCAHAFCG